MLGAISPAWLKLKVMPESYRRAHCPEHQRHKCVDNDTSFSRRFLISNYWAAAKTVCNRFSPATINRAEPQIQTAHFHHLVIFLKQESVFQSSSNQSRFIYSAGFCFTGRKAAKHRKQLRNTVTYVLVLRMNKVSTEWRFILLMLCIFHRKSLESSREIACLALSICVIWVVIDRMRQISFRFHWPTASRQKSRKESCVSDWLMFSSVVSNKLQRIIFFSVAAGTAVCFEVVCVRVCVDIMESLSSVG